MAFSFYGCRIAKNARAAGGADRQVKQSVRDVTALLHLALRPPWGAQSLTAKDAEGAKEEKSFTAKRTIVMTRTKPETTPIPTFPLRGKENFFPQEEKHSLPLRGRARVGVVCLEQGEKGDAHTFPE